MSHCDHKTEAEYGVCNRCTTFERIARRTKKLIETRAALMRQMMIGMSDTTDELERLIHDITKDLEKDIQFATDAKLWDPIT